MTDTNQTPEPTPAETPTAPLPTTPETPSVPGAMPQAGTTPPQYAEHPAHPHGVHVHHPVSEGAIVIMILGALLFGVLSFGVGWHARGAAARFQAQHTRVMGQGFNQGGGYGHGFGGLKGRDGRGGFKMRGAGRCFGQSRGQDQGSELQLPPGHPDITN